MVKSKKVEGVQIRAQGPCPILCDVHTPESPSQRPMGTVIRGFNLSGMNQPVPARIQGFTGSGIPGHLDPPIQGARRIPESSAEGFGDSTSLPASPCRRPGKKRTGGARCAGAGVVVMRLPGQPAQASSGSALFPPACCVESAGFEKVPRPYGEGAGEGTNPRRAGPGNPGCPDSMNPGCGDSKKRFARRVLVRYAK